MSKRIGLIDVDGHNFPNIPLMKLSAWHKSRGDHVEWYNPMFSGHMDKVYMSKVFGFSDDYQYFIDADEIVKGGSGYCISLVNGKEVFDKTKDIHLPYDVEHTFPDYSIYGISDTAYGFLSRGCPRGCSFCHVEAKEGRRSVKVSDLSEFWNGQKNIVLCDPNILDCRQWKDLLEQLIDSGSTVYINQGLDIRLMTPEKAKMLKRIKLKNVHFAWDRYQDKETIIPKFKMFKQITGIRERDLIVYVLSNFDTTIEQDLERIYTLRDLGYWAYVMIYNKKDLPKGHELRMLQRYVNNRFIFSKCKTFEEYKKGILYG